MLRGRAWGERRGRGLDSRHWLRYGEGTWGGRRGNFKFAEVAGNVCSCRTKIIVPFLIIVLIYFVRAIAIVHGYAMLDFAFLVLAGRLLSSPVGEPCCGAVSPFVCIAAVKIIETNPYLIIVSVCIIRRTATK